MQDHSIVLGFTAGELSPWLSTRFDIQQYQRGAAHLENFTVQPYGGVRRRNGTAFVAMAAIQEDALKLYPFYFDAEDALLLEFFLGGVRFFKDGHLIVTEDGNPYVLETPWTKPEMIDSLRLVQINDVIYATCPNTPPCEMRRYSNTRWTCAEIVFSTLPRSTYQIQSRELMVKCPKDSSLVELELSGEGDFFNEKMVGKEHLLADAFIPTRELFLMESLNTGTKLYNDLKEDIAAGTLFHVYNELLCGLSYYRCVRDYSVEYHNGSDDPADYPGFFSPGVMWGVEGLPYEIMADWELRTYGTWNSHWELRRSYDTLETHPDPYCWEWEVVHNFFQNELHARQNWAFMGSEPKPCRMALFCVFGGSVSLEAMMSFKILGGQREYVMKIEGVESPTRAIAKLESNYIAQALSFYSRRWSLGAFGATQGYPCFAAMHEGRLWLGGTAGQPTTLRASAVDDYYNYCVGSDADDALHLTLASDDQSRICWISPTRHLLLGTSEGEWTLSGADGNGISASNASFMRQSSVGSENIEAYNVENSVFYVQRGGKRLREISYKLDADGFTSTDTSLLAEHLFSSGVKEWAVQRGSSTYVWVLMNDGSLAVLTTNVAQQVTAWQRVSFDGAEVLHITALPSSIKAEDELWFVLRRHTAQGSCLCIERICAEDNYLDGMLCFDSNDALPLVPHFAGQRVCCYSPSHMQECVEMLVSDEGVISPEQLPRVGIYRLGRPFASELMTMPMENELRYNAVSQYGRLKLRLLESDPHFSFRTSHAQEWENYDPARDLISMPYTGSIRLSQIPKPGVGQGFALRCDGLMDFKLLSLSVEVDYHGK